MEFSEYIPRALDTESKIDHVVTDKDILINLMKIYIAVGNMLDYHKKNIFYGKKIDNDAYNNHWDSLINESKNVLKNHEGDVYHTQIDINPRIFHAIVGIATEATELFEAALKNIEDGETLDLINLGEELGDLNWYEAILVNAAHIDWPSNLDRNIKKLEKRNKGKKFNADATINRDTDEERKILEDFSKDKRFLDTLLEVAKRHGWNGDYIEISNFVASVHDNAGFILTPDDLEPYDKD